MYIEEVGLKVFTGPMFSEKSGRLIHDLNSIEKYEEKRVIAFKPDMATRDGHNIIKSRIGLERDALEIPQLITTAVRKQVKKIVKEYDVIGFDESQFFKGEIVDLIKELSYKKRVLVAGLNMDYEGNPFGKMGDLMAMADDVDLKLPVCKCCKKRKAKFSQRLNNGIPEVRKGYIIQEGDNESYEPRCIVCFVPPTE